MSSAAWRVGSAFSGGATQSAVIAWARAGLTARDAAPEYPRGEHFRHHRYPCGFRIAWVSFLSLAATSSGSHASARSSRAVNRRSSQTEPFRACLSRS